MKQVLPRFSKPVIPLPTVGSNTGFGLLNGDTMHVGFWTAKKTIVDTEFWQVGEYSMIVIDERDAKMYFL